jgi:hypothetical protein
MICWYDLLVWLTSLRMRFLSRLQLGLLLVVAAGLGLLFGLTDYAGLASRVFTPRVGPYFGARRDLLAVALTPARYQTLCLGLLALAFAAASLLWLTRPRPTTSGFGRWARAARGWRAALARPWRQLSGAERALAGALLAVVAGARLYYAGYYPLSLDEIASYDFYTLPGAAVTASYYPFPNNHILANLLVGQVHGLWPGASPALALRLLPTLAGVLALPLVYALALRAGRFGVATLGLGLYWLSPLGVYYAVAGRGYAWALLAALAGIFAALELLRPGVRRATRQLAWAVFGGSGLVGLYAVPTHLYALLAVGLGLLLGFGRQPARLRRLQLAQLAVATLGLAAGAGVLYAPVGVVSGWPALLANPYVARHAWPEFSAGIGPWLLGTAAELLGQRGLSAVAYCGLLALTPVALRWGRLPGPARRLGWLLLVQLGLWLLVVAAQHVYPPARTLLLVLLAFFLLLGLVGQAVWGRWQVARGRRPTGAPLRAGTVGLLAVVLLLYGGYRLRREQEVMGQHTRQQLAWQQAYDWLRGQPLRRIWVAARADALLWQHYALAAGQPALPLVVLDDVPPTLQPGAVGEVQVLPAGAAVPDGQQPVRYANEQVRIVPVSPTQPLVRE